MNQYSFSRFTPLVAKLRGHPLLRKVGSNPLLQRLWNYPLLRQKRFWVAMGIGLLVVTLLVFWTRRTIRRAEMQRALNESVAFRDPPLEVMFPRVVADTPAHRALLEPGVRLGFWVLRPRADNPGVLEVGVTNAGLRLFSGARNQLMAIVGAGRREVTQVLDVRGDNRNRQVRFRYRWTERHPATGIFGEAAPEIGREYEGEALAAYENERWKVLHWTTPLEESIARFRELGNPADR